MTPMLILNIILALAVVGGVVRLLSSAIVSSRADVAAVTSRRRHPVPNPYMRRPRAARPRYAARPLAGRSEPAAG